MKIISYNVIGFGSAVKTKEVKMLIKKGKTYNSLYSRNKSGEYERRKKKCKMLRGLRWFSFCSNH